MFIQVLRELFKRDLKKLEEELLAYPQETDLWKATPGISNSGGNLVLHLAGNLQHFIGGVLGQSGYVRHREEEFTKKNISREELLREIRHTAAVVESALSKLDDEALKAEYPLHVLGREMTVAYFLVHLSDHLNYHLGQLNYHRRLLGTAPAAVS